jgi:hypothetical protein
VYVDAFAPAKGQTLGQLVSAHAGSCVLPAANMIAQPYPGAPAGAVDVYIKQSVFPSCMANGLPKAEALALAATQGPLTSIALSQKSGVPAWKTIPSWAVIGTADHAIPPAELVAMAEQARAHITFAHGAPHLSMIYAPGLVTRVILEATRARPDRDRPAGVGTECGLAPPHLDVGARPLVRLRQPGPPAGAVGPISKSRIQ